MENKQIISVLKEILFLLGLKGENQFRLRAYQKAIRVLENETREIETLVKKGEISSLAGIGKGIAALLKEIIETNGRPEVLLNLKNEIPREVRRFKKIEGLGASKIRLLWKEYGIDSWVKLKSFVEQGKILEVKGFGPKNVARIKESLEFLEVEGNYHLLSTGRDIVNKWQERLKELGLEFQVTGKWRRGANLIDSIEFLVSKKLCKKTNELLLETDYQIQENTSEKLIIFSETDLIEIVFYYAIAEEWGIKLNQTTGNQDYLKAFSSYLQDNNFSEADFRNLSEKEIYQKIGLPYIAPELRETGEIISKVLKEGEIPLVELKDLKGVFHSHSTYSDGRLSLEELVELCLEKGYFYLGISDHSQSAYYAGGLTLEKLEKQKKEIKELNKKYQGKFKILWGIESDILMDGNLDYTDEILAQFDFVIGSIHSGLKQSGEELTERFLKALDNPYLTFLGHPTGRLLTMRKGGEIDHLKIIEKLQKTGKGVEINCNPYRLDIDWKWLPLLKEKRIPIYLSPDIHQKKDIDHLEFGIKMARKGGLTKNDIVNCLSWEEVKEFWKQKKKK